jgi:hypothetical protein
MPRGHGNDRNRISDLSPANNLAAITPDDEEELEFWTRAIYVGGAGDIVLIAAQDTTEVTLKAVPAGTILPIIAKQVLASGTAATDLVALF